MFIIASIKMCDLVGVVLFLWKWTNQSPKF